MRFNTLLTSGPPILTCLARVGLIDFGYVGFE